MNTPFDFTPYKRIVCFGDSITHGGKYHIFLQEYFAENDPTNPRRFINRGISGDTVPGLLKRLDTMLKDHAPDLVIIMIGINDLQFSTTFTEANLKLEEARKKYPVFNNFENNLRRLIGRLETAGVKVLLLSTPPYNESSNPAITEPLNANMNTSGVNNLLIIEKKLVQETKISWIDINTPLTENLEKNDASFPRGKCDRVHPSDAEHLIIAQTILGQPYTPGKKAVLADNYRQMQDRVQQVQAYYHRIPDECKTTDEHIAFYKKWVSELTGKDFDYWSRQLPTIIQVLQNHDQEVAQRNADADESFNNLYLNP